VRPLVFGLIVVVVVGIVRAFDLWSYMSLDGLRTLAHAHGPYGPLLFAAILATGILMRVPMIGTMLIAAGAVLFGAVPALMYGWVGAVVGTTGTFLVVRYFLHDYVLRLLTGRVRRLHEIDERLARHGFWTVLGLRLILGLAPVLNWGLGVTRVRFVHYVAGTALGIVPNVALAVVFADAIANRQPGSGTSPIWIVLGMLIVGGVVSAIVGRRLLGAKTGELPSPLDRPPV
jgi:uncharacterized membrane protein YdjX (TVP38/TMEM64 family)